MVHGFADTILKCHVASLRHVDINSRQAMMSNYAHLSNVDKYKHICSQLRELYKQLQFLRKHSILLWSNGHVNEHKLIWTENRFKMKKLQNNFFRIMTDQNNSSSYRSILPHKGVYEVNMVLFACNFPHWLSKSQI